MGGGDVCVIGCCNNQKRYPDRNIKHSNVTNKLVWHRLPRDEAKRLAWIHSISKGRKDFTIPKHCFVCSNHFIDGKPTEDNPNPTMFLTPTTNAMSTPKKTTRPPPRKRLAISDENVVDEDVLPVDDILYDDMEIDQPFKDMGVNTDSFDMAIPLSFTQITRESDVATFTGLHGIEMFKSIFNFVQKKASVMAYWDGSKNTTRLRTPSTEILLSSPEYEVSLLPSKPGPPRKLSLEQEFLMTMMRLRLGLLIEDLAFRFGVSAGKVSQTVITWIKLLSKELTPILIIWPSRGQIRATLPDCFKNLYPKVRTIIDCTEVFMDTPSSLEVQAYLWSDYKHHCTVKFLIAITPNGATSWISPLYGGRTSDMHIVRNSGFLDLVEPYDQVMADRGFKMKTDLAMKQCTLCIPPSAAKGAQMVASEVKATSNVANVRIFVEQAIKRIKEFRILKTQQPLLYLPLMNDIVKVCGALVNLRRPLAS